MAKQSAKWNYEHYRYALLGDKEEGLPGLRSMMTGFDAKDGFGLRQFKNWTKYQRQKVRKAYADVKHLEAQPRKIVRPRNKETLKRLQQAFHGDITRKNFKVALVPNADINDTSRLRYSKDVIWEVHSNFKRGYAPFDKKKLVTDTKSEVMRTAAAMHGAEMFYIQTGQFQTLNAMSKEFLTETVQKYMHRYDGVTALPRSSGNSGDDPRAHHWKYWLNGIIGIAPLKGVDVSSLTKKFYTGMKEAKERRKQEMKKVDRPYGTHKASELLRLLVDESIDKKEKARIKYELTRRGVKYK